MTRRTFVALFTAFIAVIFLGINPVMAAPLFEKEIQFTLPTATPTISIKKINPSIYKFFVTSAPTTIPTVTVTLTPTPTGAVASGTIAVVSPTTFLTPVPTPTPVRLSVKEMVFGGAIILLLLIMILQNVRLREKGNNEE